MYGKKVWRGKPAFWWLQEEEITCLKEKIEKLDIKYMEIESKIGQLGQTTCEMDGTLRSIHNKHILEFDDHVHTLPHCALSGKPKKTGHRVSVPHYKF